MSFDPKKLGEEADQMIQTLNQSKGDTPAEDQDGDAAAIAQEVVDNQSTDQGTDEAQAVSSDEGVKPNAEPEAKPADDAVAQLQKQIEQGEQRYRVLQGMINKKDEEIEAMRALFASLNAKQDTEQKPAAPVQQELLTKKDYEEYGNDLIDVVLRGGAQAATAEIAKLRAEFDARLAKLEGSVSHVAQVSSKTAQELFFDGLTSEVSDWRTLNTDSSFLGWLNMPDQFSGVMRMDLLQSAVQNGDVHRAAHFFNAYKAEVGLMVAEPAEQQQQVEQPTTKSKLERLAAPGKAKATTPKSDANKHLWTRAEIAKLYDDKMAGRITAKQFDELERDMFAAQSEGRIAA